MNKEVIKETRNDGVGRLERLGGVGEVECMENSSIYELGVQRESSLKRRQQTNGNGRRQQLW